MTDRYNKLAKFLIGKNKKIIFDNNLFTDEKNKFF